MRPLLHGRLVFVTNLPLIFLVPINFILKFQLDLFLNNFMLHELSLFLKFFHLFILLSFLRQFSLNFKCSRAGRELINLFNMFKCCNFSMSLSYTCKVQKLFFFIRKSLSHCLLIRLFCKISPPRCLPHFLELMLTLCIFNM